MSKEPEQPTADGVTNVFVFAGTADLQRYSREHHCSMRCTTLRFSQTLTPGLESKCLKLRG